MIKRLFLFCFLAVLYISCADNIRLDIDNPSNEQEIVFIDDDEILLKPNSTTTINVERGYHSIKSSMDSVIDYKFYENHYLINPLLKEYLIEKVHYSKLSESARAESDSIFNDQNSHEVIYLGYIIEGNFEVYNAMVIPRNWTYGPRVELPSEIMVKDNIYAYSKTIWKMYAPDEFINYMNSQTINEQE